MLFMKVYKGLWETEIKKFIKVYKRLWKTVKPLYGSLSINCC